MVAPFLPPAEWPRWRAMDWGYRRPFSIGWYALRPADSWTVRYREYCGSSGSPNEGLRLDPQVVAAKMRLMETHECAWGMRFFRSPADPSIWGEHGHETSVGMLFQREGFRWIKAATGPGSRVSGAHVIGWLLKSKDATLYDIRNKHRHCDNARSAEKGGAAHSESTS